MGLEGLHDSFPLPSAIENPFPSDSFLRLSLFGDLKPLLMPLLYCDMKSFSSPELRSFWPAPRIESSGRVRNRRPAVPRISAQLQKFETIAVAIGYKNGQLLRLCVILAPTRPRAVALAKRIAALGTRMDMKFKTGVSFLLNVA